jgi:hypothetical protein
LLISCSSDSEPELPRNEAELQAFLVKLVDESNSIIEAAQQEAYDQFQGSDTQNSNFISMPVEVKLSVGSFGLVWERVLLGSYSQEEIDAMQILFDRPLDLMQNYCTAPVLDWMENYDYTVRERLRTEDGVSIHDFLVNLEECEKYNQVMNNE